MFQLLCSLYNQYKIILFTQKLHFLRKNGGDCSKLTEIIHYIFGKIGTKLFKQIWHHAVDIKVARALACNRQTGYRKKIVYSIRKCY